MLFWSGRKGLVHAKFSLIGELLLLFFPFLDIEIKKLNLRIKQSILNTGSKIKRILCVKRQKCKHVLT